MDITNLILDKRHIKAGLRLSDEEHLVFLKTKGGTVIGAFTPNTDREHIRVAADDYLSQIDYQE